jgi:2-(1,2-epoxy-1,2-dihydrophenyl)acetyl-CoA isomerase
MPTTQQPVTCTIADRIATITLQRPEALNALDPALLDGLREHLAHAHGSDDVGVVVITGAGRAFCAGGDLRWFAEGALAGERFRSLAGRFHLCIQAITSMPKPVIAAVNGPAAGGGFSLALACDLRVMADDAFLQLGYTTQGLAPDGGGSFTLPRLVGLARALEIAMLDPRLDAKRCTELGLVHRVVARDRVLAEAQALARDLEGRAATALGKTKLLLHASAASSLADQLERERLAIAECGDSPEGREGVAAFLDKRAANYRAARRSG